MLNLSKLYVILLVTQIESTWQSQPKTDFRSEHAREVMRLAKSAEMKNYMDIEVSPCDDFYRFACGNWPVINPANKEYQTGIFSILTKAYDRRLERLLSAEKRTDDSAMERKVKYFFESCMDKEATQRNYREKLLSVLEEFGGMPVLKRARWNPEKFDWLQVAALILHRYGIPLILGAEVRADLTNNKVSRLYVGQNDDPAPAKATEYYAQLQLIWTMDLNKSLGVPLKLAEKTAAEMADFERKLAEGMFDPFEGLGIEDKTRLRLLEDMTESYKPTLDFVRYVRLWLGYDYRLPVYEYVESYQRNLMKVMAETPRDIVANYMLWMLLQEFRIELEETPEKQRKHCVEKSKRFFVKYLDKMVYRDLMQEANSGVLPNAAIILWREMKKSFELTLQSNVTSWMTNSTREKALEKLSTMTMQINAYEHEDFENHYGGLIISTNNYFENVINILELEGRNKRHKIQEPPKMEDGRTLSYTPAYLPELNRVSIPVSFLQPRYLWDDFYPSALKFATIGYIIAHELMHGFDETIRKYDAQGNLNNWWDKISSDGFAVRKACLRQQYAEFKFFGQKLKPINTQDENIADNAGLRIAFDAYQRWLHANMANATVLQHEALPHMNYTPQQIFFIGAAQVWCTDVKKHYRQLLMKTDVHAPEEVRVTGMLSNFNEFAKTFECALGTKMNPLKKCVLY